jgi:cell shape-determining protein MreC
MIKGGDINFKNEYHSFNNNKIIINIIIIIVIIIIIIIVIKNNYYLTIFIFLIGSHLYLFLINENYLANR